MFVIYYKLLICDSKVTNLFNYLQVPGMDLEYLGTLSRVAVGTGCLLFLFYDYSMPPGRTQDAFEAGADRSNAEQKDALRCQGLMCHLPPDPGRDRKTGPRHAHKHPSTVSRSCNYNINVSSLYQWFSIPVQVMTPCLPTPS